jgi:hypothetical protein
VVRLGCRTRESIKRTRLKEQHLNEDILNWLAKETDNEIDSKEMVVEG